MDIKKKRLLWHLGNTTVRSPFRLRAGLIALSASHLQGNMRGYENEIAFCKLLGDYRIVDLREDKTYSVGRKWRSALTKLGFLVPRVPSTVNMAQMELGQVDIITPNGWRLIHAESVPAMQECFLRSLAAYYIPSPLEKDYGYLRFSPLRHTLAVMLGLEQQTGDSKLNFLEMALIVQLTGSNANLDKIIKRILKFRSERNIAMNKRAFDNTALKLAAKNYGYEEQTFRDYADANFRYLKATGLVQNNGKGISIYQEKHKFIEYLINDIDAPINDKDYLLHLCNGAVLPTDHKENAIAVLNESIQQLAKRGIKYELTGKELKDPADINLIRYRVEEILTQKDEEEFAAQQVEQWQEISEYMDLLIRRKHSKLLPTGKMIQIPQGEAPAYFEWILWRAFLAINNLKNPPYEARKFKVDQDFLPIGTAPGNGPDLIFEFEDFVLVVEVTLTENSRQEAAEGEPVRRHVANIIDKYPDLKVYGLFIANKIDNNTAETFRIGVWYKSDDNKIQLNIIPLTLTQFKLFFEALFKNKRVDVRLIQQLLDVCDGLKQSSEAPKWKAEINNVVYSLTVTDDGRNLAGASGSIFFFSAAHSN